MLHVTFAYLLHRTRPVKTRHDKAFAEQHKPVQAISPQKSAAVFCIIPRARQILESFLDCCVGNVENSRSVVPVPSLEARFQWRRLERATDDTHR